MSRKDPIIGKGPQSGNSRSKAMNATKRKWNVNLQNITIMINGKPKKVRLSTSTIRTMKRKGIL
ncbi:MAG: 50S ribosomal protein L28 [Mycoplasmataceae bacterium]|nr:50S ribosomal protein L28 [Mycoplasmataceae bacterium]